MRIFEAIDLLRENNHVGLYYVYIRDFCLLQNAAPDFASEIISRKMQHPELDWTLIYIGKACGKNMLYQRFRQEFLQETRGTFFRSIGAVMNESPRLAITNGEIINYIFEGDAKLRIINFIEDALCVEYVIRNETENITDELEIEEKKPILNIVHNKLPSQFLIRQRERCRKIAAGN